MKCPIFIFSLPRSGSTLLQRMLGEHEEIATESEPWFLLHLFYALRPEGTLSEYSHRNSRLAIQELIQQLPSKQEDYLDSIRLMSDNIYSKLCRNNEVYFLDKTPRYYQIAEDLFKLYPNGKFIFLFRNPMDIYASTMKTWGNNTFKNLYSAHEDLEYGWDKMTSAYRNCLGDKLRINYEKLVSDSKHELHKVFDFLDLKTPNNDSVALGTLSGKLGDQTGIKKYSKVEKKSVGNWQLVFNTNFRKKVIKSYISRLKPNSLQIAGYDSQALIKQISDHKVPILSVSLRDRYHIGFYKIAKYLNAHLLFTKAYSWARKKYLS